jgi:hypothetical protein
MKKEPLKNEIIMKLAMLKNSLQLLIDSGRYKDRRAHMISDVEYDRRVKKACLDLSNDAIDSMVGAAIINGSTFLKARWKMLRSKVIKELNREYSAAPQAQGIEQDPAKPHSPARLKEKGQSHGVSKPREQAVINSIEDQGREPGHSSEPQWDTSKMPMSPEPAGPGPEIS